MLNNFELNESISVEIIMLNEVLKQLRKPELKAKLAELAKEINRWGTRLSTSKQELVKLEAEEGIVERIEKEVEFRKAELEEVVGIRRMELEEEADYELKEKANTLEEYEGIRAARQEEIEEEVKVYRVKIEASLENDVAQELKADNGNEILRLQTELRAKLGEYETYLRNSRMKLASILK